MIANIGEIIFRTFFCDNPDSSIQQIWECCPNKELWEAINIHNATIITRKCVMERIQGSQAVYILPEPLPAMYLGVNPTCAIIQTSQLALETIYEDSQSAISRGCLFTFEPLYIVSLDRSWMIVMTPENTPEGQQLCVLVPAMNKF